MKYWLVGLVVLVLTSCTTGGSNVPQLPIEWDLPDSGNPLAPPLEGAPHECHTSNLESDVWHCGMCNNQCSGDYSDNCTEGSCMCGTNTECASNTFCFRGECISPDVDGRFCEFAGDECHRGQECILSHCTTVECVPEDCDGYDNDCDGEVDEGNDEMPLASFCYNGSRTVDFGDIHAPCMAGVSLCSSGTWSECYGEHLPAPETGLLACDTEDNDCDGCIDGELVEGICQPFAFDGFDILYVFDTSGSMGGETDAVREATRSFSSMLSPDMRFGIVVLPGPVPSASQPIVIHDFSSFAEFEEVLSLDFPTGRGDEPNWDAVYEAINGEIEVYDCNDEDLDGQLDCEPTGSTGLAWRERSIHIIVLFTDEHGQSYRSRRSPRPTPPLRDITQTEVCDVMTRGEVLVTATEIEHETDYQMCGITFELTEDAVEMANELSSVLVDPCRN